MDRISQITLAFALSAAATPSLANPVQQFAQELPAYLECVPYARQVSGIQIYGDAWTWWDQAEGRYARGRTPKVGAVMSFQPHGNMRLGHVAAVSRVIDSRTVLLRHANWSPIDGRRGQIEEDVRAIDVSAANDWSEVRVWYAPLGDLGTTAWPVSGFIYPDGKAVPQFTPAVVRTAPAPQPVKPSGDFLSAFADMDKPAPRPASAPKRQVVAASAPIDLLAQLRR